MGLRLEGRLRSRAFRFKFEFAAFQRLVGRPQGRLQALDLLDALPVLSRSSLEQFAGFVEFPLVGLLPRLPSLGPLLFRLLQSLFGFLEGALAFLHRLQGRLRFEGSFRCRAGGLLRSRFALSDAGFARCQRGFAVREVLRLGAQFRELGLEHGFPLTQLSGLSGALPKLVDFVLETRALRSRLIDRSSRLREFSGNLLLSILTLSSGGLRFRLRGFEASHQLRDVFPRDVEIFLEGAGSIRLRLDGRLRPGDFRLELEFAAFQRFIGGPQRRLQTRDFVDALRVFSLSSLEKLAGFVEFPRTRLLLGFRSFRPLAFRLLQSLFGFLEGALAFLDRLQGRLRIEGSFRSRTGDLVRSRFALSDAGFVRSECGIAVSEILRSGVEPCELGFQVGFLPAQFSCLSCALTKLVDLFLEACDFSLLFLDCTSCLGEFAVDRLFLILKLAARSVRFRADGLQGAYRLRQVFSRGIEVFLEGAGSIRLRLEGRLRASDLGFEFDFAALQGCAGRLKGCPQTFGFLGPLRNLPSPGLEEFPVVLDLARASLVLDLVLFCQSFRSFLDLLLGLLRGSFSFFDCLERLFGLQHSLRRKPRRFFGLRLPRLDLGLTAREGCLPVGEGFRSPVEFRPLGPQVRFLLGEFAGFARSLSKFVHLIFQAGDPVLLLVGSVLGFRELRGQRGLSVLALASCGLRLCTRRLQVPEHLREVLPGVLEVLLEFCRPLVRMIPQRLSCLRELGLTRLELRAGRFDLPLGLFHVAIRRIELLLAPGEGLLAASRSFTRACRPWIVSSWRAICAVFASDSLRASSSSLRSCASRAFASSRSAASTFSRTGASSTSSSVSRDFRAFSRSPIGHHNSWSCSRSFS